MDDIYTTKEIDSALRPSIIHPEARSSAAVQRRVALGRARESDRLCHAAGTATTWSGCFYRTPPPHLVAPDCRAAGPPMSPRQPLAEPAGVFCCLAGLGEGRPSSAF